MSEATVTTITPAVVGDPKIEAWLDEHHVTWRFEPALALERIDMKRSLANQARVDEPLIADTVEMYTVAYKDGAQFPPIICRQTSARARLVNLDGNHRASSAVAAKRKTHPAYIVECTDEAALTIMYEFNMRNGAQLPRQQRIAQAVHLVALGWEQEAAARKLGVQASEVSNARKVNRTSARARDLGVNGYDGLPMSVRLELARLDSDPRLQEATNLVVKAGLAGEDVKKLVAKVKGATSDEAALTVIGTELEERRHDIQRRYGGQATTRRAPRATPFSITLNACDVLLHVKAVDVDETAPTADARTRLRATLKDTAKALMAIEQKLRP